MLLGRSRDVCPVWMLHARWEILANTRDPGRLSSGHLPGKLTFSPLSLGNTLIPVTLLKYRTTFGMH